MRPRPTFFDLSKVIIGACEKPSQTGRRIPDVRIGHSKVRYQGQCARCGGARMIASAIAGIKIPCPECTGYQPK